MLSDELIEKIGIALEALPPKPSSRQELDLLISHIAGEIRDAQERGATYVEIARQMTQSGYPVKVSTLRLALQRYRKDLGLARSVRRPAIGRASVSNQPEKIKDTGAVVKAKAPGAA